MNTLAIASIAEDSYATEDVYVDNKFLLLGQGTQYTAAVKKILMEWEFAEVYTKGSFVDKKPYPSAQEEKPQTAEEVKRAAEAEKKKISHKNIIDFFNEYLTFATEVYEIYKTKQVLKSAVVIEKMKQFCLFVRRHKTPLLILQAMMPYADSNYIISHIVRSTVFSVVIGIQMDLKPYQLFELATACLLHEIGLTQLPEDLYMKDNVLSETEKKPLSVYPLLSFKILKAAKFPPAIYRGVLDHHERKDGSGIPQKISGDKISLYGKIIAVAVSYEASISPRNYKKAKPPAVALNTLIKTEKVKYDESVLRALLQALSMFPIGSYVLLSNNAIAQVIDVNPKDPRYPVVRVLQKKDSEEPAKIIKTDSKGVTVVRPAYKEEMNTAITGE